MNNFTSLFENSEFIIEYNNNEFSKEDLIKKRDTLCNTLLKIYKEWDNKLIYIDIKDRLLFFILFFVLMKLNSKVVFLPNEIKQEDYLNEHDIFITDNKEDKNFIIIRNDLKIKNIINFENKKGYSTYDNIYLYTSGSTGKAKLIPKEFKNIYTEIKELKKIFNIEKNYNFYFTPPLYHIYGFLFGLALPLYCNSKIILTQHFTPESIIEFIKDKEIDIFISIPYYYEMFEKLGLVETFSNIKHLVSSSAPLSVDLSKLYYNKNIKITEIYGSTETGGIAHRVSAISLDWKLFSYVKTIKKEVQSDEQELFIDSPAISVFYDKELGYNTGDIVNFKDNNKFVLLGRNVRFVKIAGKRVDLNFVQNKIIALLEKDFNIETSSDCIYIFEKDSNLVMIYDIENLDLAKLKESLKKHLASYAVPKIFIKHFIPKNTMNKIDKQAIDKIYYNFISER